MYTQKRLMANILAHVMRVASYARTKINWIKSYGRLQYINMKMGRGGITKNVYPFGFLSFTSVIIYKSNLENQNSNSNNLKVEKKNVKNSWAINLSSHHHPNYACAYLIWKEKLISDNDDGVFHKYFIFVDYLYCTLCRSLHDSLFILEIKVDTL